MFLISDAFRRWSGRQQPSFSWPDTTVLLVSYAWDPLRDGAEAPAGRRLVRRLLESGARVHVLASSRADSEYRHVRYGVTVVDRRPFPSSRLKSGIEMVRSTIPEAAGPWVPAAVDTGLDLLSSLPRDTIIYGRAAPGVSNIVGWHLARRTGRPFVAHFSDEWPSFHLLTRGRRWLAPYKPPLFSLWRRRIAHDAGALTFTNPAQARSHFGRDWSRYWRKAFVVTHLPTVRDSPPVAPQYRSFHVVHTGNFYPPAHSAAAFVQGVARFLERTPAARASFRVTQAGWSNGDLPAWVARCGLGDVTHFAGRLAPDDVLRLLDDATLLVGIDYSRPHSTTILSKLPDYVAAGRPVLVITDPSSAMHRLFHEDGVGQTAHHSSPEEVARRIDAVFNAWQRRRLDEWMPRPDAERAFSCAPVLGELGAAFATAGRAARDATGLDPDGVAACVQKKRRVP